MAPRRDRKANELFRSPAGCTVQEGWRQSELNAQFCRPLQMSVLRTGRDQVRRAERADQANAEAMRVESEKSRTLARVESLDRVCMHPTSSEKVVLGRIFLKGKKGKQAKSRSGFCQSSKKTPNLLISFTAIRKEAGFSCISILR